MRITEKVDYGKLSFEELKALAEMGAPKAQNELGFRYAFGTGIKRDAEKSIEWLKKASEQGFAEAQYMLGFNYINGDGIEENHAKAVELWKLSAEQNYAPAMLNLGICYREGDGVEKNLTLAVELFKKSAEQGFVGVLSDLGDCYYYGTGVEQDYEKAASLYRKGAEQNDAICQNNLGLCYFDGNGVAQNSEIAVYWFGKSAEQNFPPAQLNFGKCYLNGDGVRKDKECALEWFRKAAGNGDEDAKKTLKAILMAGDNFGVKNSDRIHCPKAFEERIAELDKKNILIGMAKCLLYSQRGLCVDGYCERCAKNLGYRPIFNSQGEMMKCVKVAEELSPHLLSEMAEKYEAAELKQGEVEKIDFSSYKNISDLIPKIKSQFIENIGYKYMHIANWMNEDTYFYLSQGEGVKCVELPKLTGKYIALENWNDIEILIGSPRTLYRTYKNSIGDVYDFSIQYVSEGL